jgi:hypothetical protein
MLYFIFEKKKLKGRKQSFLIERDIIILKNTPTYFDLKTTAFLLDRRYSIDARPKLARLASIFYHLETAMNIR